MNWPIFSAAPRIRDNLVTKRLMLASESSKDPFSCGSLENERRVASDRAPQPIDVARPIQRCKLQQVLRHSQYGPLTSVMHHAGDSRRWNRRRLERPRCWLRLIPLKRFCGVRCILANLRQFKCSFVRPVVVLEVRRRYRRGRTKIYFFNHEGCARVWVPPAS